MFQTYSKMPTMSTQALGSDSDSGWSSDDDWVDSDSYGTLSSAVQPSNAERKVESVRMEDATPPVFSMEQTELLPNGLSLVNYVEDETGYALYRCEPANKMYPGVSFVDAGDFKVCLSVQLYNSKSRVQMRTPDIKTKGMKYSRTENGILLKSSGTIHFKKKCLDKKTKKDLAFELGKSYLSHTSGITPQFLFIAVPFKNGRYIKEEAFRSPPFRVYSKRQERFLQHKHKRQKKNVEVQKLDTDIHDAETTLRALQQELSHQEFIKREMETFFNEMRRDISGVGNETARTALEYALRQAVHTEIATL